MTAQVRKPFAHHPADLLPLPPDAIGCLVVLGVAALLATLIPTIRAARVAPLIALQQE